MEVVIDANEGSKALVLNTKSIIHIVIMGVIKNVGRTIATLIDLRTTLEGTCVSLAISNADVIKPYANYDISTGD